MSSFECIDDVQPSRQFGRTGPDGWGFTLWGKATCSEDVHRRLLETFAATHPGSNLVLPPWHATEDLIEGSMSWEGVPVWVWFETVLNFIWLWSAERSVVIRLRDAILPFARMT